VNHVRGNKNIVKAERTMGTRITHGGDWETGTIADHNGRRTRRMGRSNGRKETAVWSGVVRGTRVSDPVGIDRGQYGKSPGRWLGRRRHSIGEHGRPLRLLLRSPRGLERPHQGAPGPWVGEGWPGRTRNEGGGGGR